MAKKYQYFKCLKIHCSSETKIIITTNMQWKIYQYEKVFIYIICNAIYHVKKTIQKVISTK